MGGFADFIAMRTFGGVPPKANGGDDGERLEGPRSFASPNCPLGETVPGVSCEASLDTVPGPPGLPEELRRGEKSVPSAMGSRRCCSRTISGGRSLQRGRLPVRGRWVARVRARQKSREMKSQKFGD